MCCRCGDVCWKLEVVLYALEMLEGVRHVYCSVYWRLWSFRNLLEMLEVLDVPEVVCRLYAGGCGMREVLEVMRCVLLCMLEAVDGELCLQEALEAAEVVCCVLVCMLEAVECGICLLEVLEVIRCV